MVGTLDVDGMLDELPEGLFQEWCEYDRVEPIGTQPVCDVVTALAMAICDYMGLKGSDNEPLGPGAFQHWLQKDKPKPKFVSPEEAAAKWRRHVS